jgi:hypothetical protein
MDFRSLLFCSASKKSDLASTLQTDFPHLSVQSCKVSCKVLATGVIGIVQATLWPQPDCGRRCRSTPSPDDDRMGGLSSRRLWLAAVAQLHPQGGLEPVRP